MRLSDFDFALPDELIAQTPSPERSASRLLHVAPPPAEPTAPPGTPVAAASSIAAPAGPAGSARKPADPGGERLDDLRFADLPALLASGDLLVLNDTRVIHARLLGSKPTGGRVELLVERVLDPCTVLAQLRASHPPAPGGTVAFGPATATVVERRERFFVLRFDREVEPLLADHGRLPLPPYIRRPDDAADDERYQTVYARHAGSVAAPTAGLHFDEALLARLRARGIETAFLTLHVGAGTFQPVQVEDVARHRMHAERFAIPVEAADAVAQARRRGGRIVAVGTTSLRSLEAAARDDGTVLPGEGETDLFILPGYRFRVVDALLTNFHLPRSTLLMLACAFAGTDRIRRAYAHAVQERYRFFSYGDAMLLHRAT